MVSYSCGYVEPGWQRYSAVMPAESELLLLRNMLFSFSRLNNKLSMKRVKK
jgi:hypothetical protein